MRSAADRIEREILLEAPRSRVWRALTDVGEFGAWFRVALEGKAFEAGKRMRGRITHPGYEHVVFEVLVERVEPESRLSWRWHPAALDSAVDYSTEPATLVEFELRDVEGGTLLTVVESGFDRLPPERRLDAYRMNSSGWDGQMHNIDEHVAAH